MPPFPATLPSLFPSVLPSPCSPCISPERPSERRSQQPPPTLCEKTREWPLRLRHGEAGSDSALPGVSARVIKPRLTLHLLAHKDSWLTRFLAHKDSRRTRIAGLVFGPLFRRLSSCNQSVRAARPDALPKPSIRASVPSRTESRDFTSCNQE